MCIANVRSWFIANRLMINDAKTEFLIIGTRQQLGKASIESIIISDTLIKPLESVRNLESWFDAHMRLNVHICKICGKAFRGLYNIRQIRKFLTVQSTKTLVHAFISSHLDYCNALLFGLPKYQLDRLQKLQNAAVRGIFQIPKFDHTTPSLIIVLALYKFLIIIIINSLSLSTIKGVHVALIIVLQAFVGDPLLKSSPPPSGDK